MNDPGMPALELRDLERTFTQGDTNLEVLRGVALSIGRGELIALTGPSGSGKSTLLQIAGLLERPDGGDVIVNGQSCGALKDGDRTAIRRTQLGFIYQFHHLLPEFSAIENVVLPQMVAGKSKSEARERSAELLALVGLSDRTEHRPAQLSGGEQQRVAIARALANEPHILLADEPTGNLDEQTADTVFSVLREAVNRTGVAALIATHNMDLADMMDRRFRLHEGRLVAS